MQRRQHRRKQGEEPLLVRHPMWVWSAHVLKNTAINILCFTRLATCHPSDDYNRVILKLDEGHSRDSNHDEEEEEDESSDEEDDGPTKYINASHINVRLSFFFC